MLTLFSVPKAFSGHAGVIQDNAIASWARLGPGVEVVLFGDDPGVDQAALRHGVSHVPTLLRTAEGAPRLDGVFAEAARRARHPLLCYVNADIVLMEDFTAAVRRIAARRKRFLLVSSRFDLNIDSALDFAAGWQEALRARAAAEATMYGAAGSDLFVYPRDLFADVPPLALGRGYWDNWLMYAAKRRGAVLIDGTQDVLAVHQNHDYSHIGGGPAVTRSEASVYATDQGIRNLALAGGVGRLYTVYDADYVLRGGHLISTLRPRLLGRRLKALTRRIAMVISPSLLPAYHRARNRIRRLMRG